jgi:hypothetical protein
MNEWMTVMIYESRATIHWNLHVQAYNKICDLYGDFYIPMPGDGWLPIDKWRRQLIPWIWAVRQALSV